MGLAASKASHLLIEYIVNKGNGSETRQSSFLYVFVLFFAVDHAQNTIVVYNFY